LTRDQIEQVMGTETATPELPATAVPVSATKDAAPPTSTETPAAPTAAATATDTTSLMPAVAHGVTVRWVATSAAWLADIGGDPAGRVLEPAILARVHLRYDEAKADLIHDVDQHVAVFPLDASIDATRSAEVAVADTDLLTAAPAAAVYRLTSAPIGDTTTWKQVERSLIDHLVRTGSLELYINKELKLYSQPDESAEDFRVRCAQAAQAAAEGEKAEMATKHASKVAELDGQLEAAQDRASVVKEQAADRKRGNLLRAAGDLLGGIFGSRRSAATKIGSAADRLTRTADGERVEEAAGKVERLEQQRNELDATLAADTTAVDAKWSTAAAAVSTLPVGLERTDVKVTQLLLAWIPVP
jgi:hypothetical protein